MRFKQISVRIEQFGILFYERLKIICRSQLLMNPDHFNESRCNSDVETISTSEFFIECSDLITEF